MDEVDLPLVISLSTIGLPDAPERLILLTAHESMIAIASKTVDFPEPFTPTKTLTLGFGFNSMEKSRASRKFVKFNFVTFITTIIPVY